MNPQFETLTKLRLLLEVDGIGSNKLFNLLAKFNSIDELLGASFRELLLVDGISRSLANRILKKIDEFPQYKSIIENEINRLDKLGGNWITFWSKEYPKSLKNIFGPPIILYYKGNIKKEDENSVAIVGTRVATRYGKGIAEKFANDLASKGITIVSGLARGIDSFAHRAALKANGRTIAIIGSGLDVIYPSENKRLFDEIAENGVIYSEYILGTKPDAQNFPKRNRIISGISLGTLVIETKETGGALQTAAFALDQNREVFAIPGNLGISQSEGTNLLIQRGEAKLVKNSDDILVELNLKIKPKIGENIPRPTYDLNLFEQLIFDQLSNEPMHIDAIAIKTNISSSDCLVHLLTLEFRDLVQQLSGKNFIKV